MGGLNPVSKRLVECGKAWMLTSSSPNLHWTMVMEGQWSGPPIQIQCRHQRDRHCVRKLLRLLRRSLSLSTRGVQELGQSAHQADGGHPWKFSCDKKICPSGFFCGCSSCNHMEFRDRE